MTEQEVKEKFDELYTKYQQTMEMLVDALDNITLLEKQLDKKPKEVIIEKEVVIEPSEEDAMNAIFGSDIKLSKGGVAIQTFKDEHFVSNGNNVTIQCDYVITKKEDIPYDIQSNTINIKEQVEDIIKYPFKKKMEEKVYSIFTNKLQREKLKSILQTYNIQVNEL